MGDTGLCNTIGNAVDCNGTIFKRAAGSAAHHTDVFPKCDCKLANGFGLWAKQAKYLKNVFLSKTLTLKRARKLDLDQRTPCLL